MKGTVTPTIGRVLRAEIENVQLRERAAAGDETECTELFVATVSGVQVGLLSLDLRPLAEPLELYEIFVDVEYRGRGIGSLLLAEAESIGRRRGYSSIRLKPHSLDARQSRQVLVEWYARYGYVQDTSAPDLMTKLL
jgi:GNAT superfamily N-acetyltransferase